MGFIVRPGQPQPPPHPSRFWLYVMIALVCWCAALGLIAEGTSVLTPIARPVTRWWAYRQLPDHARVAAIETNYRQELAAIRSWAAAMPPMAAAPVPHIETERSIVSAVGVDDSVVFLFHSKNAGPSVGTTIDIDWLTDELGTIAIIPVAGTARRIDGYIYRAPVVRPGGRPARVMITFDRTTMRR